MKIFKQLKKLGYNHYSDLTIEELDTLSSNNIKKRIEYYLVTDWFREKHNIHIIVSGRLVNDPKKKTYKWEVYGDFEEEPGKLYAGLDKDYYTAYKEAILKAIELIKTK